MLTRDECKRMLSQCGFKFGISPRLIGERLLSNDDKKDMVKGLINHNQLYYAVKIWKHNGAPNYSDGDTRPIKLFYVSWYRGGYWFKKS